ncbi:MAG: amidase family protein [Negativicutes bacterium]
MEVGRKENGSAKSFGFSNEVKSQMAGTAEFIRFSATEIRELIGRKEISPSEVIESSLTQIERYNKKINAVVTISEQALDDARKLEREASKSGKMGLLHGLPAGIKDVTPVAGLRTTYGSLLYKDNIPNEDALVVQRLRAAGSIILGKTNTPEFATGANTFNDVFGCTRNPWDSRLSVGGSTGGGAAALVTGMISLAEGTDLGGSLRIPASFCGVVGLRPSPGLIPTYPSDYLWDNMQVTGPMARTAEDVALMLQACSGPSPLSPMCQPTEGRDFVAAVRKGVKGLRVAYCRSISGISIDEEVEAICRKAAFELAQAGAVVEEVNLDLSADSKSYASIRSFWMVAQQYHRLDKVEEFGVNLKGNVKAGLKLSMEELGAAEQARGKMWHTFYTFFQKYDIVLTPCVAVPPFPVEQNYPETIGGRKMNTYMDWVAQTFILSLTGLPCGCVPAGLNKDNLPVGLEIIGRPRDEETVLALAKQVQSACPVGLPSLSGF